MLKLSIILYLSLFILLTLLFSNSINKNSAIGQISDNILQQNKTTELKIQDLFSQTSKSVVQVTVIDPLSNAQQGLGSGFLYDKEGHIITNNHVVAFNQGNNNYLVTFLNGNSYQAELIGNDPYSDLAVIKLLDPIDIDLNPIPLGNSSSLRVGDTVVAIGNPFGLSGSLTVGVVSGLGRLLPSADNSNSPFSQFAMTFNIPDVIQTDAAINPGNSGGPLLNLKGEVIGINSAIYSNTGVYTGVGFAIPASTLQRVVPVLISEHSYKHPWIGISGVDVNEQIASVMKLNTTRGFLVIDTSPGGPASKAGIQGGDKMVEINGRKTNLFGDVIVKIDNQNVSKIDDILVSLEQQKKVGQGVNLTVVRDGKLQIINVVLAERPLRLNEEPLWLGIDGIDMDEDIASELKANQSTGILVVGTISDGP